MTGHTDKRFFFVSCIEDGLRQRKALLAGPYDSHDEALDMVPTIRRMAEDADPRAHWYAFGTAGSDGPLRTVFGKVEPERRHTHARGVTTQRQVVGQGRLL